MKGIKNMLNCAVIMGRLTADPELKTTQGGISVTSFCVAVDRNYVKQGEERETDFINIVAWRQTADFVTRYFHKGSMIAVQGSIQTRPYEDKSGIKRTAVEIVADNVSFCGSKQENNTQNTNQEINNRPSIDIAKPTEYDSFSENVDEDDVDGLPF